MNRFAKIIITFTLLSLTFSSFSQVHFGGRAGLNVSFLSVQPKLESFDLGSSISPKIGAGIAALGYFEIGPYFAIQPEIVYNRKGLKSKIDEKINSDTIIRANWNQSFDYIEVPLMFKLSLNSEGFDPFIEFGAYYGYLMRAKYKADVTINFQDYYNQDYISDFKTNSLGQTLNRNEYGFKVGVGGTLAVSKGVVFFSIRYSQGLNDMIDYQIKPEGQNKTYNRVFQLTVGYAFELRSNNENKIFYY